MLALALSACPATAQQGDAAADGPFACHSISAPLPAGNIAVKGIAIRLGAKDGPQGAILFDTELCRVAAGWTGGFLQPGANPSVKGTQLFGTRVVPGWANPDARLDDPRPRTTGPGASHPYGPLPHDWATYKGLYVHGDQVVLRYTLGGTVEVLELPGVERVGEALAITRTIKVAGHDRELRLRIAEVMGTDLSVKLVGIPSSMDAVIEGRDGALFLRLPARREPTLLKLLIGLNVKDQPANEPLVDPETLTKGGPPRAGQAVETKGEVAAADGDAAYVVDRLPVPEKADFTGLDFFDDGRVAALCSPAGDVWTCSGIDGKIEKLAWRRFASGLCQPTGVDVMDGRVHVLGRDGITRLHDVNDDGAADFYERVTNDVALTPGAAGITSDLQADADGNFYFAVDGVAGTPHDGTVLRVSRDGLKLEAYATGLRAPRGIGVGPGGQVTASDGSGGVNGPGRIHWLPPGPVAGNPLCWLPAAGGSQIWVTSDKWGPLAGRLLHTSPSAPGLFLVFREDVASDVQGGVVGFPLAGEGGVTRARFNPQDGQLYAVGDSGFRRIRFTGKPVNMPAGLKVTDQGIELTFASPLERERAAQPGSYTVEQWNYVPPADGTESAVAPGGDTGRPRDALEVTAARVSEDGKTVSLQVAGIRPVMQMHIRIGVASADGRALSCDIHNTVNRAGNRKLAVRDGDVRVVEAAD